MNDPLSRRKAYEQMTLSLHLPAAPRLSLRALVLVLGALALAGCAELTGGAPRLDASGASVRGTYTVTDKNVANVRLRGLETVNNARQAAGVAPVVMDHNLEVAAMRHSASMSQQQRAWPFGAQGDAPTDRVRDAGYPGHLIGELMSETYETEVQAIDTWLKSPEQRTILLDPQATRIGLGVFQDPSMKLWWTLTVAQ